MRRPWRRRTAEVQLPWLEPQQPASATKAGDEREVEPPPVEPPPAEPASPEPTSAEPAFVEPSPAPEREPGAVAPVFGGSLGQPSAARPGAREEAPGDGEEPRPEVLAGAAFAGGLVVAMLVRRVLR